jgi:TRAP-type C4-dicarboxylate transport system substrate-binding protein
MTLENLEIAFLSESIRHHFTGIQDEVSDKELVELMHKHDSLDELYKATGVKFHNPEASENDAWDAVEDMRDAFVSAYQRAILIQ